MGDPTPSDDDLRTLAHVDGYRVGAAGRPCAAPLTSLVLCAAWVRGWRLGRQRIRPELHQTPERGSAPSSPPDSVEDTVTTEPIFIAAEES